MNELMMSLIACLHLIKEARRRQFRDSVKFLLSPARMICVQWNSWNSQMSWSRRPLSWLPFHLWSKIIGLPCYFHIKSDEDIYISRQLEIRNTFTFFEGNWRKMNTMITDKCMTSKSNLLVEMAQMKHPRLQTSAWARIDIYTDLCWSCQNRSDCKHYLS